VRSAADAEDDGASGSDSGESDWGSLENRDKEDEEEEVNP